MAGFSIEALERGIEGCKKNIQTFEDAIEKERATIKEYHGMIEVVERKKREAALPKKITIPVTRDSDAVEMRTLADKALDVALRKQRNVD